MVSGFFFWSLRCLACRTGSSRRASSDYSAPPVNLYDFSNLAAPDCPWLLIQGTYDEVVPAKDVARWAGRLYPTPKSVYLDAIDHYFHGKLNVLQSVLSTASPPPPIPAAASTV